MRHIEPGSRDHDHWQWILSAPSSLSIEQKNWLDIGCGSGLVSAELSGLGARRSVGVDILPPNASINPQGWEFYKIDLNDSGWTAQIPDGRAGFNVVTCFDIVEHLDSPVEFLTKIKTLLAADGRIVITTPNTGSWERVVRGDGWSGATDPQHKILFSTYSLRFLLERLGFRIEIMRAPIRKLAKWRIPHPAIGAQIFIVAKLA